MAWDSLADFFAAHHNCTNWDLQKAVMRCARGRYRESLCKAAYAWQPEIFFHKTLKRIMLAAGENHQVEEAEASKSKPVTITPAVTLIRKELERWLKEHGYPLPPPPPPSPLPRDVWDIFNATDRYSKEDIKGGIWHAMYGDYGDYEDGNRWQRAIQQCIRWRTPVNAWEHELAKYMLGPRPARPAPRTTAMYNLARRTKAWFSKSSFAPPEKTYG